MTLIPGWKRREFLKVGTTTTVAVAAGAVPARARQAETSAGPRFRTSLCDLLGIEYPVLQAGMTGVAGPALVAAVSRAGGLGILG